MIFFSTKKVIAHRKKRHSIASLKNIGPKVAKRLRMAGIKTVDDLYAIGTVEAYRRMRNRFPRTVLPTQYYVFALEGALLGIPWQKLPNDVRVYLQDKKSAIDSMFKRKKKK